MFTTATYTLRSLRKLVNVLRPFLKTKKQLGRTLLRFGALTSLSLRSYTTSTSLLLFSARYRVLLSCCIKTTRQRNKTVMILLCEVVRKVPTWRNV